MLKILFNPAVVFTGAGMVLMLLYELRVLKNPWLVLLGPPLFTCGLGFFIPQFVWEDSALFVAVTLMFMMLNWLVGRFTRRTLWRRTKDFFDTDSAKKQL
jgi:hypothetical protein